jgi:two-component system sensor histidine kinase VanS
MMLLAASLVTYGILALVTPSSYASISVEALDDGLNSLSAELESIKYDDAGERIVAFCNKYSTNAVLIDPDGVPKLLYFPSEGELLSGMAYSDVIVEDNIDIYPSGSENPIYFSPSEGAVIDDITPSDESSLHSSFSFSDRQGVYTLRVNPQKYRVNAVSQAFAKTAPWLLLAVLIFSSLCSFFYTRFMDKLRKANAALERDIEFKREQEVERLAFFSAVSHELKTPITVLKGQLTGMLDGVDVYRDRDKYLARALTVTGRMEGMVQELLTVTRLETLPPNDGTANLSALLKKSLELYDELIQQNDRKLRVEIAEDVRVRGDEALLSKALDSILSNAVFYSLEGAELFVTLTRQGSHAVLNVTNGGVTIPEEALPHLFEPFFRVEKSRSRATGGSGLGLYLVKLIFDRVNAEYEIENVEKGVRFTGRFVSI